MKKLLIGVATAVAFVLPVAALASTNISDITFDGSGPNVTVTTGSTVNSKVTLTLTAGSEVESLGFQLVDNTGNSVGVPQTCVDVSDRVVAGTYTVEAPFDTTGSTEGTFGIRVKAYGITGPGADNNCGGTVNDNQYFSNRITFTESANSGNAIANNTGGGSGGSGGSTNQLSVLIALLTQLIHPSAGSSTPPASTDAQCAAFTNANVGTQPNVYNSGNIALQGYLLSQHMSIPALTQGGASFGFYGNQTTTAVGQWRSMHPSCI